MNLTQTAAAPVYKTIKYLVLHCTASPEGVTTTGKQLIDFFMRPVAKGGRGWKRPGYVDIFHQDGTIENLVPYDNNAYMEPREISNGVAGFNSITRSVAYIGGTAKDGKTPKDTRTEEQKEAMANFIRAFVIVHPNIKIAGHNQFAPKACPSFNVPQWLREIGIPEKNIETAKFF